MAATFSLNKTYGASPGTTQGSMGYMHLSGNDAANNTSTAYQASSARVSIPSAGSNYSYEGWYYPSWSGSYNEIYNVKVWKSAGVLPTGLTLNAGTVQNYATPVNTVSAVATAAIPTSQGTALSPTVRGSAPNNTADYVVLQAVVASTASPGDQGDFTITWEWTEA